MSAKSPRHVGVEMRDGPSLHLEILSVDFSKQNLNYKIIAVIIILSN